ncbi:hypothetical protein BGZ65_002442 [Modicella reniformis]|uniref:Uncharacterized protein n=1 Tax=Modicella reniformis TaxID=1440133 RepID=A0A9P6LSX9_9FUNG|nr:hypothetical protein BGZ65_002442 [Modicella reniformis]
MSPVSRQARINHIIGYVDRQRELVTADSDEEIYLAMLEKVLEGSVATLPLRTHQRRNSVPNALDPSLALPRALPKNQVLDREFYRNSTFSAVDVQHIDNFDSESPSPNELTPDQDRRQGHPATRITSARPVYFRRHTTTDDIDLERHLTRKPSAGSNYRSKLAKLGALSFLRGRRAGLRRSSCPEPTTKSEESGSIDSRDQTRFNSLSVKQMFLDAFKKASKASSETTKEEQGIDFPIHQKQLFALWPQTADLEEDFHESSSSDQSPNTLRNPWTPELAPLAKLRDSPAFNRDLIGNDFDDDDDSQTTLQSSEKIPIANLIRELTAFGLDYISHPTPMHKMITPLGQEQPNDIESAGLRHSNCAVAAM